MGIKIQERDGLLYARPTRDEVESIQVGDEVLNVFGQPVAISRIYAKGHDIEGKAYACFYAPYGKNGEMSGSIKEGEIIPTIPLTSKWHRIDSIPVEALAL